MFRKPEEPVMAWTKPQLTEIPLGAEINSYAPAPMK